MTTPLPSLEPRRLLRDRAANALLWCAGVGVILAPGAVVTMALVALLSDEPGPCEVGTALPGIEWREGLAYLPMGGGVTVPIVNTLGNCSCTTGIPPVCTCEPWQ